MIATATISGRKNTREDIFRNFAQRITHRARVISQVGSRRLPKLTSMDRTGRLGGEPNVGIDGYRAFVRGAIGRSPQRANGPSFRKTGWQHGSSDLPRRAHAWNKPGRHQGCDAKAPFSARTSNVSATSSLGRHGKIIRPPGFSALNHSVGGAATPAFT